MVRFLLSLLFPAVPLLAQHIGVGLKGGVPLSDVLHPEGRSIGGAPFLADTQRFTLGPMLDIRLPLGLGFEFDALYKRFDQTAGSVVPGTPVSKTGSSWEFPLLGKYRFPMPIVHPYVEAGVTFNRLGGVLQPWRGFVSEQPTGSESRRGVALGAGIEVKVIKARVSAELRYSHWGEKNLVPSTNLADFLIGISF